MMTTTSSISPANIAADVGEFETACECVHCASHRGHDGARCDHPAKWIARIVHMAEDRCNITVALCDLCTEAAKAWAIEAAAAVDEMTGGRCVYCGAKIVSADDILTVVALK